MEYCLNVFEQKLDDLIKISINERYANGDGVLFLNFVSLEKLDVFFHPIYDKKHDCLNKAFSKRYMDFYLEKFKNDRGQVNSLQNSRTFQLGYSRSALRCREVARVVCQRNHLGTINRPISGRRAPKMVS